MPNSLLSRPPGRSEPRSVRERAVAIARAALRILLPQRHKLCDLPGVRSAIRQHLASLRAHRCASASSGSDAAPHAQAAGPALHEFAVLIHCPGESTQERTVWARCSVDVALDVLEGLQREGRTRSHVQVKALGAAAQRRPQ